MAASNDRIVTVFGSTGFLGRRVVRHLRSHGFSVRIDCRHPDRSHELFARDDPHLRQVAVDIHDERAVATAASRTSRVLAPTPARFRKRGEGEVASELRSRARCSSAPR
jgi:uncharacterized protein YbjT (DUF2867 family)